MALKRTLLAFGLIAAAALALPATAQEIERPNRPSFLQGLGLLETQEVTIRRDDAPFATISLPQGGGVRAIPRDLSEVQGEVIAAWDFATEDGLFIESLTLTAAELDLAPPELRRFALANMFMLRTLPQLREQFPTARVIAFGPIGHRAGLDLMQMVGTFAVPDSNRGILFRHIGVLQPGTRNVLVAIVNIDTSVFPMRTDTDLVDTFAGRALDTLRLPGSDPDEAEGQGEAQEGTSETGDEDGPEQDDTGSDAQ